MPKFQSLNPNWARIDIDFDKKVPVKFEYPNQENMYFRIVETIYTIFLTSNSGLAFFIALMIVFMVFMAFVDIVWFFIYAIGIFVGVPMLGGIVVMNNENIMKRMPQIQASLALKSKGYHYYKEFDYKDIKDNKLEIPYFDNIFMFYKATDDLGKKLKRIKVRELDFHSNIILRNKQKRVRQTDVWKATFEFDKKPKRGRLKVWFL